jgi:hypothetical protein
MDKNIFPLPVLLFSVGGVHYGVSADQIASVAAMDTPADPRARWLHQEMGYQARPDYRAPAALSVRAARGVRLQVVIDAVEDIFEFGAEHFRPLPPLVASRAAARGLWGAILRQGRVYLLVDFTRWDRP